MNSCISWSKYKPSVRFNFFIMKLIQNLFIIIGLSISSIQSAHALFEASTSVDIHNKGDALMNVAAVYRVGRDTWKTKAWYHIKPHNLAGWVDLETGINGSNEYYLAVLVKNNSGEVGYPEVLEYSTYAAPGSLVAKQINKQFCINDDGPTDRNSSFSDLTKCPPGYSLKDFTIKVTVPLWGANVTKYGVSSVGLLFRPDGKVRVTSRLGGTFKGKPPAPAPQVPQLKHKGVPYSSNTQAAPPKPPGVPLHKQALIRFTPLGDYNLKSTIQQDQFRALVGKLNTAKHRRLSCTYGPSESDGKGFRNYEFWYQKVPLSKEEFALLPDYPGWRNLGRTALEKCPEKEKEAEKIRQDNWSAWRE